MTGGAAPSSRKLTPRLALVFRRDGRVSAPAGWPAALAARTRRIDYGAAGALLLADDGADRADNGSTLLVVAGALRTPGGGWRSAAELAATGAITSECFDASGLTGSALLLAIDLQRPRLAALANFVSMQTLYWAGTRDGFAAATEPRLLLPWLDRVELDEEAVPAHFLFRYVAGERTYFRGVRKLMPGSLLRYDGEAVRISQARTLRDVVAGLPRFDRIDERGVAWLDARMSGIAARWVDEAARIGAGVGNLLSGGLDSSLVQAWLNDALGDQARRSYSFAVAAPSFEFEVDYARDASRLLGTRHETPRLTPDRYLDVLDRTLAIVGEPSLYNEGWPGHLLLAETLAAEPGAPRVLFTGYGADVLLGDSVVDPVQRWLWLSRQPERLARLRAALPRLRRHKRWSGWVDAVETSEDARTLAHPLSHVLLTVERDFLLPGFGAGALTRYFDEMEELERSLFGSDDLMERLHVIDFLTAGFDPHLAVTRLYQESGLDLVHLYLDEEALASGFAFAPEVRYLRPDGPWPDRFKPLQQEQLFRRGLGELVGRTKGGTAFNSDFWRWMSEGVLRERFEAVERPDWLSPQAMAEIRRRPTDFVFNLLTFDLWKKQVLKPASIAAAAAGRQL